MFTRRRGDTELASAQCRHRGRRPCSEWGSDRPVVVQNRQSNFPCFLTGRGRRAELSDDAEVVPPAWEMRTSRRCPSSSAGIEADDAEVVPPAAGNADIETMSLQQKCSLCFVPLVHPRLISFATLTARLRSICALSCFVSPQVCSFTCPEGPQFSHPSLRSGQTFGLPSAHCRASSALTSP